MTLYQERLEIVKKLIRDLDEAIDLFDDDGVVEQLLADTLIQEIVEKMDVL